MAGGGFYRNHVANGELQFGGIEVVTLTSVLEDNFNHVVVSITAGDVLQIVVALELTTDGAVAATAG